MSDDWRRHTYPCNVCDQKSVGRYTLDLDIKGFCFCEEHRDQVFLVYMMVVQGTPEMAEGIMKDWKYK